MFAMATIALVAGTSTFTSCKKGENDPFLSLRSRKARLTGEWTLKEGVETHTNTSSSGTIVLEKRFTETEKTETVDGENPKVSRIDSYNLTFEKDGKFQNVIVLTLLSNSGVTITNQVTTTQTIDGVWSFYGGNKDQEIKNKEAVVMEAVASDYSQSDGEWPSSVTYTGFSDGEVWFIDQLKNKEIILKKDVSLTHDSGSIEASSYSMTYTQE